MAGSGLNAGSGVGIGTGGWTSVGGGPAGIAGLPGMGMTCGVPVVDTVSAQPIAATPATTSRAAAGISACFI
ncbi:hypothetical protein GCM10009850_002270 [Nonomuraea monospora]|uniref:Uncharacterized protein n=1 Tax=Nonomuraea monospora TaxID=568818 RepID=A0ABP5NXL2_9ACTN